MGLLSLTTERRNEPPPSVTFGVAGTEWGRGNETYAGVRVTDGLARQLTAVWACQSLIADGVSTLPWSVRYTDKDAAEQPPAPSWIGEPNPDDRKYAFLHKIIISLLSRGDAFVLVKRRNGAIDSLWVLDPQTVTFALDGTLWWDGKPRGKDEVIHIPAFTIAGRIDGLSPIDYAANSIGLTLAAEEYGARFFSQGTTMSGVIEHPGTPKPGEVGMLRGMFKRSHQGTRNSHAIGILTGGAKWQSVTVSPEQAQFLETRRFQNTQIAQMYRVPSYMVDPTVTSTWGSGIEEQNKFFVTYTLMPWISRIEEALSILVPDGQRIKFNLDSWLRAKTTERYKAHETAVNNGWLSINEVRALEDLPPVEGGNRFRRPLNIGFIDDPIPTAIPDPTNDVQAAPDEDEGEQETNE